MSAEPSNQEKEGVLFEEPTLLRNSSIWDLQRKFYEKNGVNSWKSGIVPCFITSNSFIAYEYANCILGFLRDVYSQENACLSQPVYIVEIGAGHGKLGYLILNHLLTFRESFPKNVTKPFVYVITDFTPAIIDSLKENPLFSKFVDDGILDFGLYDCEKQQEIELLNSGVKLNSETMKNPSIFISNYVFNGLKQDLYSYKDGELQEGYVTVFTDKEEENKEDPSIISRMRFKWFFQKRESTDPLYEDEQFNKIIQTYQERHNNFTMLFPYGPLLALKNMKKMTNNRYLLLCADKAYSHEDDSKMFQGVPHIALHGCFSLMVNFHALRIYTLMNQGYSVHTPYYNGLKVAGYVFGFKKEENNEFRLAFNDTVYSFDPDTFSVLQRCIQDETPAPSLPYILSLIRLSKYESEVFYKFKTALIDRISNSPARLLNEYKADIRNIAKFYFPIQSNKDIYFDLGRLCLGLRDYDYGIELFNLSTKMAGEHHITWYNLGICYFYKNDIAQSLRCFLLCLRMSPSNTEAMSWKTRLETQLTPAQILDIQNSIEPKTTVKPAVIVEDAIPFEVEEEKKNVPHGEVLDIDVGSIGDDGEITRDPFEEEEEKPVEDPFKEEEQPAEYPFKEEEQPAEDPFKEEEEKPAEDPFKEEEGEQPTEDPFKEEEEKPVEDPFKEEEEKPVEDPFKEEEEKPVEDPFKEGEQPTEDPFKEEEEKPVEDPFKEEEDKPVEDPFKEN